MGLMGRAVGDTMPGCGFSRDIFSIAPAQGKARLQSSACPTAGRLDIQFIMDTQPKWRRRALTALENYFRNHSHPRLTLLLIVTAAGVGGLVISHVMLHFGVEAMCYRYPVAVLVGYGIFLGLLRIWVEVEREAYDPAQVAIPTDSTDEEPEPRGPECGRNFVSWWDWFDVVDLFRTGEGCLVALFMGLLVGMASLLVSFILAGPEFLAEVFLDAVVVTMLYRHLKTAAKEHWLGTAVRRTWKSALLTAGLLAFLGWMLDLAAPDCHSIGPAMKAIILRSK